MSGRKLLPNSKVSMPKQYRVVKLDSKLRIFDFTPTQLGLAGIWILCSYLLMCSIGYDVRFGNMPLRTVVFMTCLCCFPLVRITDIRPLGWWQRRLTGLFAPPSSTLPAVHWNGNADANVLSIGMTVDETVTHHVKISLSQMESLGAIAQQSVISAFFNSVENSDTEWQLFWSPKSNPTATSCVYIVTTDGAELATFKKTVNDKQLIVQDAEQSEIREIIYRHLTPSAKHATSALPALGNSMSDVVTLSAAGFNQHQNYLSIDNHYARSVTLQNMPAFTHFGILKDIFREDVEASVAIYFNACDQTSTRQNLNAKFRLAAATSADGVRVASDVTDTVLAVIQGRLTAINMAMYATVYGDTLERSQAKVTKLNRAIDRFNGKFRDLDTEELNGLLTVLPFGKDLVRARHQITSNVASTLLPFISASIDE